jgi:hypothetical protein
MLLFRRAGFNALQEHRWSLRCFSSRDCEDTAHISGGAGTALAANYPQMARQPSASAPLDVRISFINGCGAGRTS